MVFDRLTAFVVVVFLDELFFTLTGFVDVVFLEELFFTLLVEEVTFFVGIGGFELVTLIADAEFFVAEACRLARIDDTLAFLFIDCVVDCFEMKEAVG